MSWSRAAVGSVTNLKLSIIDESKFDEYPSVQIQSFISNNSESLVLGELGANSSLRFLGPTRGVIPIGPNGIPGLGALQPSPLSDAGKNTAILSYNYTLYHQGLTSNITCIYDTQSPITFSAVPNNTVLVAANGSCNEIGLADVTNVLGYSTSDTNYTLTFWACKSLPTGQQDPAYYIYLRGRGFYEELVGNISCTVSPIQPAVFPVTYHSSTRIFSTQERITTSIPAKTFSDSIEYAIFTLGNVVRQSQTESDNLVVASVRVLGIQGLAPASSAYEQRQYYLLLYEKMIQGILVDAVCTANNPLLPLLMVIPQFTYLRFLYSTVTYPPPPPSCFRKVNGTLSAQVTGWVAKLVHIGFLMPMTILNLASLVVVLISIARAKSGCHEFDLTDPRSLVLAEPILNESESSGWADGVSYRAREVREHHL